MHVLQFIVFRSRTFLMSYFRIDICGAAGRLVLHKWLATLRLARLDCLLGCLTGRKASAMQRAAPRASTPRHHSPRRARPSPAAPRPPRPHRSPPRRVAPVALTIPYASQRATSQPTPGSRPACHVRVRIVLILFGMVHHRSRGPQQQYPRAQETLF